MCGICGKLVFREEMVEPGLITAMCRTLVHRGPDDESIYTGPHIGLGQRRLSIIDLSETANPPLSNEDKTIWVVLNGEIYNFQELRLGLINRGHTFRTRTDTEVIPHLYEEYGTNCLEKMHGMYAFALWDARKEIFFAARDRLGKKPFCYAKNGSSLVFGSEIKAILADPDINAIPNYYAIDQFFTFSYVPSPLTAFKAIYRLPPGHFLVCSINGTLSVERYWEPPLAQKTTMSEEEIQREVLRLLRQAVRIRMISDVPLGALLSGGIDSATIVALMAQEMTRPVKTFSIGFDEEEFNELPYARLIADRYGTEHHEFKVKANAAEVLPILVQHYNEPFADSSAIPTYYVSKMARQYVTVALSGDGGDETYAGYETYRMVMDWDKCDMIPPFFRRIISRIGRSLLEFFPRSNSAARLRRGLTMLGGDLPERYLLTMSMLKPEEKHLAYTSKFETLVAEQSLTDDRPSSYLWNAKMDRLDWMMRHDQNFYLPDCLMVKSDIASMANSLEIRCPFLDHILIEFASRIPSLMKLKRNQGKLILRDTFKNLLPTPILKKKKTGFSIPLSKWFRGELLPLLMDTLLDEKFARRGLIDQKLVRRMIAEHVDGRREWHNRLWAFLFLELWFREYID